MTNYHYWQYFLSLETDLITTSRYIEFTGRYVDNNNENKNNDETFSTELLRIFFAACAECENIAKILAENNSQEKHINLPELGKIIIQNPKYHGLQNRTISCPAYSLDFTPWNTWNGTNEKGLPESPQWWKDHNDVKHGRETHYHKANLSNTLKSVAALICLLFEYYKEKQTEDENFIYYVVSFPPALATKLFITDISGLGFGNGAWCWPVKEEKRRRVQ